MCQSLLSGVVGKKENGITGHGRFTSFVNLKVVILVVANELAAVVVMVLVGVDFTIL